MRVRPFVVKFHVPAVRQEKRRERKANDYREADAESQQKQPDGRGGRSGAEVTAQELKQCLCREEEQKRKLAEKRNFAARVGIRFCLNPHRFSKYC